jgi:hypothetical protein
LYSSNGSRYSYSEHYTYPSGGDNKTACISTANAFVTLTQSLIDKVINTPDTLLLVSKTPKAQKTIITEAANSKFQNTLFASTINNNINFAESK